MIDAALLLAQVAVLVLMIVPGFLLAKTNLMAKDTAKAISNLILYAAQVALLISGFAAVDFSTAILTRMLTVFCLALIAHIMFYGIGVIFFGHVVGKKKNALIFSTTFTNAGYMGIPLLLALFGGVHPEIAIYGSVYVAAFNIFVWSLGAFIYTEDKSYISVKKMFLNPASIATYIGLVLFLLSGIPVVREAFIQPIVRNPEGVVKPLLDNLKALVAPLSMIIIGLRLTDLNIKDALRDKYLYINILVSLLLTPTAMFALLKLLSVFGIYHDALTASMMLIFTAAPAATATSMFAEKHDGDKVYAGLLVSITSILCVVTMPIVSLLTKLY